MEADFEISLPPKEKTLTHADVGLLIKPKNRLRWLYLSQTVPTSMLEATSPFVLKAAVDGAYSLTDTEYTEFENFAAYVALLPGFILSRLGKDNAFVRFVRLHRALSLCEVPSTDED